METRAETRVDARFREVAARFADRPAIRHRSTVSYRELDRRSDEVAARLVRPPSVVGISLTQPVDAIAAMLGVLKSGAAYTLIDPDMRPQRKQAILEELGLELVLCDAGESRVVASPGPADGSGGSAGACCIVQTSGTTGEPLGVEIGHAALLHTIDNYTRFARITADDRLTMLTSAAHFAAHSAIFGALLNGACLCVFDVRTDGFPAMGDWLEAEKLTIYQSPPSLFRAFCQQLASRRQFPALRLLRLGGEPAFIRDFQLFQQHFRTDAQFINALGISEAAGNVAYFYVDPAIATSGQMLPVGCASAGREVFLANSSGDAVAAGEVGEIVVRGGFLATGYYRRPCLTSRKFRISVATGQRELWTGDLGHLTPEGWLMLDGRSDEQVKIRGHRVNIAGLESALRSLAAVRDAAVLRRRRSDETEELIACVVPADSGMTSDRIHRQLRDLLSSPVLPRVVVVDHLPLNPGGKINRARLAELAAETVDQPLSIAPRDETEREVAGIWKMALNARDIGVHDNFFACGGDSLQAVSIMAALETRFMVQLSPKLLLDCPTIAQLAEYLKAPHPDSLATTLIVLQEGDGAPLFFLHGDWTGGGLYCGGLHLSSAHPFCVMPPYCASEPRVVSLQEMAAEHIADIRQLTPQGPYLLGGYCIGAMVAVEVARQLTLQGDKVVGLLLIDPTRSAAPWLRYVWPLINRTGQMLQWNLREKLDCMELYGMAVVRWFRKSPRAKLASVCRRSGLISLANVLNEEAQMEEADAEVSKRLDYAVYLLANRLYRLRRLAVPTTIFIPEEGPPPSRSWARHIRKMLPLVTFQSIPGDHRGCITRHGAALGAQMNQTLELLSQAPKG